MTEKTGASGLILNEPLLWEKGKKGRRGFSLPRRDVPQSPLPDALTGEGPDFPDSSEVDIVRHYTRLSQKNFSIDTQFYPLGSCTMKYNPRACNSLAMLPGVVDRHPHAPDTHSQGFLACMYELQEMLKDVTGMTAVSLTPMAGAQGEFAGVAMIRAYHDANNDTARTEILVPDAEDEVIHAASGRYAPRLRTALLAELVGADARQNSPTSSTPRDFSTPGPLKNLLWRGAALQAPVGDQVQIGQHLFDIVDFDSMVARVFRLPRRRALGLAADWFQVR